MSARNVEAELGLKETTNDCFFNKKFLKTLKDAKYFTLFSEIL